MAAIRYTKMQSELKVDVVGEVAMTGSAVDIKVIDLTAAPFAHGFHCVMCVIQNAYLAGAVTLRAKGNTATDGSGTDTTIQTMVLAADGENLVMEIPIELMSQFSDRSAGGYFKSLIFEATGTNADTLDAVIVSKLMQEQESLTPTDTTAVS